MSLFKDSMRPPTILSDEAVERYLAALREVVEPDPLFRRRLRGRVVNRFVATRENLDRAPRTPRRMGALGRACLYASFALGLSVTGVMAASQEAVPGDLLYPLKLEVEQMRLEVLPASLHDQLAAYALGERIEEMGRLSERGDWERLTQLAGTIEHDYQELLIADADSTDSALHQHILVLNGLLERLPEPARIAVQDVLQGAPGISQPNQPQGGSNDGGSNSGGTNNGGTNEGTPTGGSNGGGANNGGSNNGGSNNGGTNEGGTNSGGSNNGGTNERGSDTGGSNTGADGNGQPNNGGSNEGGTNNGGSNNGGSNSGNTGQGQSKGTPAPTESPTP